MAWLGIDFFLQDKDWSWLGYGDRDSEFKEQITYETVFNLRFGIAYEYV